MSTNDPITTVLDDSAQDDTEFGTQIDQQPVRGSIQTVTGYKMILGPVLSWESQARQYAWRDQPGIHLEAGVIANPDRRQPRQRDR